MRFNGLDLNLLVALDAVFREMNVTRAAEQLFLSQSAMSSALSRLRAYFEDDLVVPLGRKLVTTPLGETLVQPVRDVLMRVDTTIATRMRFEPSESRRHFTVLVSDYAEAVLMAPLLERLSVEAPSVTFGFQPMLYNPAEALERGEADLLIIPQQWASQVHPLENLVSESYVCVVWSGNERVGESLAFDDYLALGHVAVQNGNAPSGAPSAAFDGWFLRTFGLTRRVEVTTPHFTMLPTFVVGTQRIATVHRRVALQYRHLPLRLLAPPVDIPPLQLVVQWHTYRSADAGLVWLRALMREVMGALP